jgi:hypothetical protein
MSSALALPVREARFSAARAALPAPVEEHFEEAVRDYGSSGISASTSAISSSGVLSTPSPASTAAVPRLHRNPLNLLEELPNLRRRRDDESSRRVK